MECGIGKVESGLVPLQEQVAMAATELTRAIIELEQAVYWRDNPEKYPKSKDDEISDDGRAAWVAAKALQVHATMAEYNVLTKVFQERCEKIFLRAVESPTD